MHSIFLGFTDYIVIILFHGCHFVKARLEEDEAGPSMLKMRKNKMNFEFIKKSPCIKREVGYLYREQQ